MSALVGQFTPITDRPGPAGPSYIARRVDLEGQPSWLLGQMQAMWCGTFRRDTAALCAALLRHDWSVVAASAWPEPLTRRPCGWVYVTGVGRAHRRTAPTPGLAGRMPGSPPGDDQQWAYLWEHHGAALHVYTAVHRRWHHIATLPAPVFATLTEQLIMDIEARRGWVEDAA